MREHVAVELPARPPFDAAGVFAWLAARAVDGVESAGPDRYERILVLPGGPAHVRLRALPAGGLQDASARGLAVEAVLARASDAAVLEARVRALFDLDADAPAIDAHLAADPVLAPSVAATPGVRVPGSFDAHELVVRALVGQQISVAAARTWLGRLAAALGEPVSVPASAEPSPGAAGLVRAFPTAAAIHAHGGEVLRGPAARIRAIVDVAGRLARGELVVDAGRDRAELTAELLAVPGIGPWTAQYLAMRVVRDPDVLLVGDLALRQGARALGLPDAPKELAARGARWAPYRSAASMRLWRAAASIRHRDRMSDG